MPKKRRYQSYAWKHPKTKLLYAKVQIKQPDGKYKTFYRRAENLTHVKQLAAEILEDYKTRKAGFVAGENMTFNDLAEWYKEERVIPAVYSAEGKKIKGMRSFKDVRKRLEKIQSRIGRKKIKDIDDVVLLETKRWLQSLSPNAKPYLFNRYFEDVKAMFSLATRKRWLKENPFNYGEKIIDTDLEEVRAVVLTEDQEYILLHLARQRKKSLLYYAMLCLCDCGGRPSEVYDAARMIGEPVTWANFFDYDFQAVKLTSYKGKKVVSRLAPVTDRLEQALMELWNSFTVKPNLSDRIFQGKSFKNAWTTVRNRAAEIFTIARRENISPRTVMNFDDRLIQEYFEKYKAQGIEPLIDPLDVRLRDFRRSLNTRLANGGMENDLRQKVMGHTQASTNFDYIAAGLSTALAAKKLLDEQIKNSPSRPKTKTEDI